MVLVIWRYFPTTWEWNLSQSFQSAKRVRTGLRFHLSPTLAKFNMSHLEDDVVALMKKQVFDLAGCLGKSVKVELNGTRVPVKSFTDYVNLYLDSAAKSKPEKPPRFSLWNSECFYFICIFPLHGNNCLLESFVSSAIMWKLMIGGRYAWVLVTGSFNRYLGLLKKRE